MFRIATIILIACGVAAGSSAAPSLEQEAREFFARYVALGEAYDSTIADIYSNDAVIKAYRRYP